MENNIIPVKNEEQQVPFTEERIASCIHELKLSLITKKACSQSSITCVEKFCWAMLADVLRGLMAIVPKILNRDQNLKKEKSVEDLLNEMGVEQIVEESSIDFKHVVEEVLDQEEQDKNCSLL